MSRRLKNWAAVLITTSALGTLLGFSIAGAYLFGPTKRGGACLLIGMAAIIVSGWYASGLNDEDFV